MKGSNFAQLPATLSVEEFAEFMGIGRVLAYQTVNQKSFPKIRIGRRILIPTHKIAEWMDKSIERSGN